MTGGELWVDHNGVRFKAIRSVILGGTRGHQFKIGVCIQCFASTASITHEHTSQRPTTRLGQYLHAALCSCIANETSFAIAGVVANPIETS